MSACPTCGAQIQGAPKFCGECGGRLPESLEPAREARKVVTILFSDVTGSTAIGERLDPEAVRGLMSRYFAAMKDVIERHGGTVEKFIGDAVMAVFGIPVLHEDDALRAVRAAVQMRESLATLNAELATEQGVQIETRTGITTGEVVAGDPASGQTLVTGDTVNTAARLEQAASPGEVLIGEPTWRLVRDAITAESVEPVNAKGKALPVPAFRLVSVVSSADGHLRRMDAPLVGRDRELGRLQEVYRDAIDRQSPQLFTLLGAAGVGKSRLIAEFLTGIADQSRVMRGRCLPYGEGITYWPLAEALRETAGITDRDDRAIAIHKILTLLEGERDAELLSARLATAIGLSDEPASQTELFWAVRRTLEHVASRGSLVVIFDDIHWAEPTFLDLIDHVAEWSRDAPLFLLASARPELLDDRPTWGGGKLNTATVLLESLPADATQRLIEALPGGSALSESLRSRIAAAAEGNPLFVEEFIGMLVDEGTLRQTDVGWQAVGDLDRLAIPPTIHALLAARLERLSDPERRLAERASVVGRVFERDAVAALSPEIVDPELSKDLLSLVRKELVRPDRSEVTGGDAFKFRHILIRDAAYAALPKRERADLHERFADWLERLTADGTLELAQIIGYHLAEAARFRRELGEPADTLGTRASSALREAADRAGARGDYPGSMALYAGASEAAPVGETKHLMRELALWSERMVPSLGPRFSAVSQRATEAAHAARQAGCETVARRLELFAADSLTYVDVGGWSTMDEKVLEARRYFDALGDERGIALAKYVEAGSHQLGMRFDKAYVALAESLAIAQRTGWHTLTRAIVANLALAAELGSTPISEIRQTLVRIADSATGIPPSQVIVEEANLLLLELGYGASEETMRNARERLAEFGAPESVFVGTWALAALLAGDTVAGAELAIEAAGAMDAEGNEFGRLTAIAVQAECLAWGGDLDAAAALVHDAAQASQEDPYTHVLVHRAEALIELGRGNTGEARARCQMAFDLLDGAEAQIDWAQTMFVSAAVSIAARDPAEATSALRQAHEAMVRKGAGAVARKIEQRLLDIGEASAVTG